MAIKIESKIVDYEVDKKDKQAADSKNTKKEQREKTKIIQMHEKLSRPEDLDGATYKITTPMSEHALYVTINDIVLNKGTEHEHRRPFEMFINSKSMEHFQWIVALTRIVSAVFRKGGDVTFLVEELEAVFDPRGGYFKSGGVFMPSLVAEIGAVLKTHLKRIGMIQEEGMHAAQKEILEQKRQEFESRQQCEEVDTGDYPDGATLCNKCNTKAVIQMDGCMTCLSCGDSKCG